MKYVYIAVMTMTVLSATALAQDHSPDHFRTPQFLLSWGSPGSAPGQFSEPLGICTDQHHRVYVADPFNNRIQVFTDTGGLIAIWAPLINGVPLSPYDVVVSPTGETYVTDSGSRIVRLDNTGHVLGTFGSFGREPGQFYGCWGLAVSRHGLLYVVDNGNAIVQRFDSEGKFLGYLDRHNISIPYDVAIDQHDNVYVAMGDGVARFDSDGHLLARWGQYGFGDGQLYAPLSIAVDHHDVVYVGDYSSRIQMFRPDGVFLGVMARGGSAETEFLAPWGLATDREDNIYCVDTGHSRIQKFVSRVLPTASRATSWGRLKALYR